MSRDQLVLYGQTFRLTAVGITAFIGHMIDMFKKEKEKVDISRKTEVCATVDCSFETVIVNE